MLIGEGPECGTSDEHFKPFATVERFCLNAIEGALQQASVTPPRESLAARNARNLRRAQILVARALSPKIDAEGANASIDEAASLTEELEDAENQRYRNVVQAAILDIYLDRFRARRTNTRATPLQNHDRQQDISVLIDELRLVPIHTEADEHVMQPGHKPCLESKKERTTLLARLGFDLLCQFSHYTMFPTLDIENRVPDSLKTDGSVLKQMVKIPIKVYANEKDLEQDIQRLGAAPDPILRVVFSKYVNAANMLPGGYLRFRMPPERLTNKVIGLLQQNISQLHPQDRQLLQRMRTLFKADLNSYVAQATPESG